MPVIIELVAFFFLISFVLFFSPVGKVIAESFFGKKQNNDILNKMNQLIKKIEEQEEEIQKLREIVIFNDGKIKKIQNLDLSKNQNIQDQKEMT